MVVRVSVNMTVIVIAFINGIGSAFVVAILIAIVAYLHIGS